MVNMLHFRFVVVLDKTLAARWVSHSLASLCPMSARRGSHPRNQGSCSCKTRRALLRSNAILNNPPDRLRPRGKGPAGFTSTAISSQSSTFESGL